MSRLRALPARFYRRSADEVARELLGRFLIRRLDGDRLVLRIVETEAYLGIEDRASHAWQGRRTARNRVLFETGGVAYVYLIYGMYYCLNAVTGQIGDGGAVLIRAGEPVSGEERMRCHRGLAHAPRPGELAGGPGKLCQALAIDRTFNGESLRSGDLCIGLGDLVPSSRVAVGRRIGIDYAGPAASWPLRFALRGSRHVSRPFPW